MWRSALLIGILSAGVQVAVALPGLASESVRAEPRAAPREKNPTFLTPILLDTDIGTDVDDAFALALVMRSPELELLGVTTVSGDTVARARLAAKMLWESGFQFVPVAAGEPGKPLPQDQTRWANGFSSPQLQRESALDLLKTQIEQRPGKITLLAIGPLTNVADLILREPATARKLRRIALMGGSIAHGYGHSLKPVAEYNIASDPSAAQAVFASGIPILMAPLDATAMLELDAGARHRLFTHLTTLTNTLTILYHLWGKPTPILFDPMAVALLIQPSLCQTKDLAIRVDAKGSTRVGPGKPNATVALGTNPKRFFDFYLSRVAP
jgi:purine nucleosidase